MSGYFITATGTDIGKTFVACALIRALRERGSTVEALKPVLSGYSQYDGSDAALLLDALGLGEGDLERISPWRYDAPLAPPSAARLEGRRVDYDKVYGLCSGLIDSSDAEVVLIEGAGGVMSPLADDATNLDLLAELGVAAVLVTGSYLGSVSHTLTALKALEAAFVTVLAVVISESEGDAPPISEMTEALARFSPDSTVLVAPRDPDWRADDLASLMTL